MQGDIGDPFYEGISPRIVRNIFQLVEESPSSIEFTIKISAFEIYKEKLRDLIDNTKINLTLREDREKGFFIEDLREYYVGSESEVINYMKMANDNRAIGSTNMNDVSSRSHMIFVLTLHQATLRGDDAKVGKLYLVDLAGSEKIKKTECLTNKHLRPVNGRGDPDQPVPLDTRTGHPQPDRRQVFFHSLPREYSNQSVAGQFGRKFQNVTSHYVQSFELQREWDAFNFALRY